MGDGHDAEEPAGRRPLPPEDRVWRHPAEVAMDARRTHLRRRNQRIRVGATLVGGVIVVSGLVWVLRSDPAGVEVVSDQPDADPGIAADSDDPADALASAGSATATRTTPTSTTTPSRPTTTLSPTPTTTLEATGATATTTTLIAATTTTTTVPPVTYRPATDREVRIVESITLRSVATDEVLAEAITVREGFLVTSSAALGGADVVTVSWGEMTETGTVVGHDAATDLAVLEVAGIVPEIESPDTEEPVQVGDELALPRADGDESYLTVVSEQSASEMADGKLLIGIVELDGRRGDIPAGTPAFAADGGLVGVATATAETAPAAIVPIQLAREVAAEIIDTGAAIHPRLGVTARNPSEPERVGSLITWVTPDGPADIGGMRIGDLLTSIDDHPIDSMSAMVATLRTYEPGDVVGIVVWRDDEPVDCEVELASSVDVAG